jgi:hypothetical protein
MTNRLALVGRETTGESRIAGRTQSSLMVTKVA